MAKLCFPGLILLTLFCACKSTSTNPEQGQKLHLITSDIDTLFDIYGPVTFTVTIIDGTGYGVAGAYIDFYDPIQKRIRYEGPTPENGEWQVTDTISAASGDAIFEFAFTAEYPEAITSDSLRLWVNKEDIREWTIDSIGANSRIGAIGLSWSRPAVDRGTDTIFIQADGSDTNSAILIPYPLNHAIVPDVPNLPDTISVHNAYAASQTIVWAPSMQESFSLHVYVAANPNDSSGIYFLRSNAINMNNHSYTPLADLMLVTDTSNHQSGVTIISPSLYSLSGFYNGRITSIYHPIQFVDSGDGLDELYYTNDLSSYVKGVTPLREIQLPDSSQYSTTFIVVNQGGYYAQVSVGPVMHDRNNNKFANVQFSYQQFQGLPYAKASPKKPAKH